MKEMLRLEKISKKLGYQELYNINLNLFQGEILTVMVRSETVKDSLIQILSGSAIPDSGNIYVNDQKVRISSLIKAKQLGIFCINQSSRLIPNINIADNIFINRRSLFSKRNIIFNETDSLLRHYGINHVVSHTLAKELSFALGHIIAILKAVALGAKILIIDNITTRYNALELSRFIDLLQNLAQNSLSIILLTNTYSNLLGIANRVTIIRNGTSCFHLDHADISKDRVLSILAGYQINDLDRAKSFNENINPAINFILQDYYLSLMNLSNNEGLHDININLRRGEILGILDAYRDYGMQLVDILTKGSTHSGSIFVNEKKLSITNYKDSVKNGIGLINSNTDGPGIFFNLSLMDNVTLMMPELDKGLEKQRIKKFLLRKSLEAIHSEKLIDEFGKKKLLSAMDKRTQMKVMIAKWICAEVKLLILVNPHSSFDDINIDILKQLLKDVCAQGISILIVSSSMQPLLDMCNRVAILDDGTIKNVLEV
jgi:ribose transport system ATP-binding protein